MSLMFEPLRKYADFQGRAGRAEYWQFMLFLFLVHVAARILAGTVGGFGWAFGFWGWGWGWSHHHQHMWGSPGGGLVGLAYGLFCLYVFIPGLAVNFRRLHDTDRSAWWMLLGLIPFVGAVVLLIFMLIEGTRGSNRFGPDPRDVETTT